MANEKSDAVAFIITWQLASLIFPPGAFSALKFDDHESGSWYFLFIELWAFVVWKFNPLLLGEILFCYFFPLTFFICFSSALS